MESVTENSVMKIRTLIVEDEPPTARFVRNLVEREQEFEVTEMCESAEAAVHVLEKNPELELIITDIRLAEMSGLELLKKVRQADREIRLIIISGYKMFEYAREAIRLNIEDYIKRAELSGKGSAGERWNQGGTDSKEAGGGNPGSIPVRGSG